MKFDYTPNERIARRDDLYARARHDASAGSREEYTAQHVPLPDGGEPDADADDTGPEPVTEVNSNGGDDDRRDASTVGCKKNETPEGGGGVDANERAGTSTRDGSGGDPPLCGAWSGSAFDNPESDTCRAEISRKRGEHA
ncbi:hypothetical protein DP107_17885 [Haloglomus irregulare]|uniref:Uncharacterized protein n=1 Tax=Haloglomus irregulare TaxID=2234134 RepID=A0A554MVM1_9EURY|nr:hypothetical protein [Haloglomus irregulare]TSD08850.1 hypothetical protein DP107_17885 [Haloglomus irregulare]